MIFFLLISLILTQGVLSGFLYSKSADSFVSKNSDRISKEDSIPLKFTIRLENVGKKTSEFKVLRINEIKGNGHSISINERGEAKLFKGEMCEAAHKTYLVSQKCSKDFREIFMWIPEDSFERFVRHLEKKRQNGNIDGKKKRRRRNSKDLQSMSSCDKKYSPLIGSNNYNSRDESSCDKKYSPLIGSNNYNSRDEDKKYSNKKYPHNSKSDCPVGSNPLINQNSPTAESIYNKIFKNYMEIFCKNNSKFEQCSSFNTNSNNFNSNKIIKDPLIPQNIMNFLLSLFKKFGINNDCKINSNKNRGIYAQGYDSLCNCKMECIKNSKNGMCFYKYKDGKLEPIMKNPNCCKNENVFICDLKNKIERLLCELTMRNDYEFFSQYIDENYNRR